MTIDFAFYGADTSSVRIKARCNANGVVTLSGDLSGAVTADTAVNDGVVEFAFSGLTSGRDYVCRLSQGGQDYEHTMHIKPLPTDALRIVFFSCITNLIEYQDKFLLLDAERPDLIVNLGDLVYADTDTYTVNGITTARQAAGPTVAGYCAHQRAVRIGSAFKLMSSRTPFWYMWDDHEIIDGWCGGINQINWLHHSGWPGAIQLATTQADVDAVYAIARECVDIYNVNPINTDSNTDSNPLYFGVRVGNLCELLVPDLCTYCTVSTVFAGAGYTEERPAYGRDHALASKMGGLQKPWWKSRLAAAQAAGVPNKITLSQKKLYPNLGASAQPNNDSYDWYRVEREDLVDWAHANVTGHGWGTGDDHELSVSSDARHFSVNACALHSGPFNQGGGYTAPISWKVFGNSGVPGTTLGTRGFGFGVIDVTSSGTRWTIKNADRVTSQGVSQEIWSGTNSAQSNALDVNRTKLA